MNTNHKNSEDESPKKDSLWQKLNKDKGKLVKNSLVDTIIQQAEKESSVSKKENPLDKKDEHDSQKEKMKKLKSMFNLSKAVLALTIIASVAAWLFFFAALNESNYIYSSFEKQNISNQLAYKTELKKNLDEDFSATKKFNKSLEIEDFVEGVLKVDLENPVLNYRVEDFEKVSSRDKDSEDIKVLYKTTDSQGKLIYISESEMKSIEDAKEITSEHVRNLLVELVEKGSQIESNKVSTELEKELKELIETLGTIDPEEEKFPSAYTKEQYSVAKLMAQNILVQIKDINLKNLVVDIKKQANAIDISNIDPKSKATVETLQQIINGISHKRPSTIQKALISLKGLDLSTMNEDTYEKATSIIGNPATEESGDLQSAATIAKNLARVNTINLLKKNKIDWSSILERINKIARLGSDLKRDAKDAKYKDSRADIDPDGNLLVLLGYYGKLNKKEIEFRGRAEGIGDYENKSFTLLADLIDGLEGSKYFQEVEGFSFTKGEDSSGKVQAPFNLKMKIQNIGAEHQLDIKSDAPIARKSEATEEEEDIDLEVIKDLDFLEEETN